MTSKKNVCIEGRATIMVYTIEFPWTLLPGTKFFIRVVCCLPVSVTGLMKEFMTTHKILLHTRVPRDSVTIRDR